MFGKAPGRPPGLSFTVTKVVHDALGGKATRKEVRIAFTDQPDGPAMDLMIYLSRTAAKARIPRFSD